MRTAAALALVASVAIATSRGGALWRGAAPGVGGLLSVPDRASLKGALAAVKRRVPAPGARGRLLPPRAAGWSIEKLLKAANASVKSFTRFEVGAGIEKKQDDFVGEVMAQVKASSSGK